MILIEKEKWMVVNKPSGWHTLECGENDDSSTSETVVGPTLEGWLKKNKPELSGIPEAGIAHRLDQKTSGCLLVAKTPETYLSMRGLVRTEAIQKTYLALVEGEIKAGQFQLYFFSRYKRSQKVTVKTSGKLQTLGKCSWTVLQATAKKSLIQVELIGRGKRHQIRAGFAFLGHPICGDTLYGAEKWGNSFGLHAWRLQWKTLDIKAPVPDLWPESYRKFIP